MFYGFPWQKHLVFESYFCEAEDKIQNQMAKWNGQNEINQMRCKLKQESFEMESVGQLGILD